MPRGQTIELRNTIVFSNLAWHLDGRKFSKVVSLSKDVNTYMFTGSGDRVAVVLSKGIGRLDLKQLPKGLAIRDLYGNDVKFPRSWAIRRPSSKAKV